MRVAIYCRVSTDEQNIEQQRDLLIKYCNEKEYEYRSYLDNAISGSISDRPEWKRLLSDCERKQFDAILVVKVDRITRSLQYATWWYYEWYIKNQPIRLISLYDSIDLEAPDGYFNFMLQCLLSERELMINKLRSRIGIERAKREGKYKGGKLGRKWAKTEI